MANNPFKISVGTTAKKISSAGNRLGGRIVRNLGAGSVFLGGNASMTSTTEAGWELPAGEEYTDTVGRGELWAKSASGSNDLQIWEVR